MTPPSRCILTTSATSTWWARDVPLPLTGRMIPVVADEHVDPAFGTGAVKVTPAHDPNDFEIGRRHGLPSITVLDELGRRHGPRSRSRGSTASRRARPSWRAARPRV